MKLSNETLAVLKNFSTINQNLEFKKGNKISTMSASKTILAQAVLKDTFDESFCVYDLNDFLSVMSLYKDSVELDFDDANVIFKSGRRKTEFRKTEKSNIVTPAADKQIRLVDPEVVFTLTAEDYADVMKSASVLSSPHIAIQSDGDKVYIVTYDASDSSQHTNRIEVSGVEGTGRSYSAVFRTENIKMIPGEYAVQVSFKGFAHFKNTKEDIEYWIAIEAKESKF